MTRTIIVSIVTLDGMIRIRTVRTKNRSLPRKNAGESWLVGHRKPVVPGTPEGLLLMREGAIFQFLVPAELAYGAKGFPAMDIPPDADLVYVVELIRAQ